MTTRIGRRFGVATAAVSALALLLGGAVTPASAADTALSCTSLTLEQVRQQIFSEVNASRAANGVAPLMHNTNMDAVATSWSQSQASANSMSHNPNYSTQIPSGWYAAAENVAYGYAPTKVTTAWWNSEGHRKNMLNASYNYTGIGVACNGSRPYYTQVFAGYSGIPTGSTAPGERLAGADRYSTSATISSSAFSAGVAAVYLTSGANFPDALSGGAAAGLQNGPVLLVSPDSIPDAVRSELTRLKPQQIFVLGGPTTVSDAVLTAASSYASVKTTRINGVDRFETSAKISAATFDPGVPTVYLSNGLNFPDALSGGAAAAKDGSSVLLVTPTEIPTAIKEELTRLKPGRIVVLGGTPSVSQAVMDAAAAYTTGGVTRLSGSDRYATSAAISANTFSPGVDVVYLASGANFPDALSGSAAVSMYGGPVLLTPTNSLPDVIRAELTRLKPKRVIALGGPTTVSDGVLAEASTYIVK
ncbi:cell wall-binding repeat-containing protein [Microbacterium sp.]|uniref:cell wall-binding repeat-containing protein n=1 Tax=Microbacterium sp. TaxID=51671 RepID=UPI0039E62E07